jgi:hypothetical protein
MRNGAVEVGRPGIAAKGVQTTDLAITIAPKGFGKLAGVTIMAL